MSIDFKKIVLVFGAFFCTQSVLSSDLQPGVYDEQDNRITFIDREGQDRSSGNEEDTVIGKLFSNTRSYSNKKSAEFIFSVANAKSVTVTGQVNHDHGSCLVTVKNLSKNSILVSNHPVSFKSNDNRRYNDFGVYKIELLNPLCRYEFRFHTFNGYAVFDKVAVTGEAIGLDVARKFDGHDDRLIIPDSDKLKLNVAHFSVCAWVKPTTVTLDDGSLSSNQNTEYRNDIISHGENEVAWDSWSLILKDGKPTFRIRSSDSADDAIMVQSDQQIELNKWTHLAATFDLSLRVMTLYVNGDIADTITVTQKPFNNNCITLIGGDSGNRYGFNGLIDELSIWSKTLTVEEVILVKENKLLKNVDSVIAGNLAGVENVLKWSELVLCLPFHSTGVDIKDYSDNGLLVTAMNGVSWMKMPEVPQVYRATSLVAKIFRNGTEINWEVTNEAGVKSYKIIDKLTGEILEFFVAGEKSYRTTVPADTAIKIQAVYESGIVKNLK